MSALFCRVLTQIFYQLVTIYSDNFIRIRSGFIAYISNIDATRQVRSKHRAWSDIT